MSPRRSTAQVHNRQVQLVGRKIRRLRKERKLTQTELSSRIGIQQSDLSRMEQGRYRVSLDTLFKILAEFEMGIGEFFEEPEPQRPMSGRDAELVEEFKSLAPSAQREVRDMISRRRRERRPEEPRDQ